MSENILNGMNHFFRLTFLGVVLTFSLVSILYAMLVLNTKKLDDRSINTYQYYINHLESNKTSKGMLTSWSLDLEEENFFAELRKNDHYILLSKLGEEEYHCTGNCYCTQELRRSAGVRMKKGIVYLLTALTTVVAMNEAKEYFENECNEYYNNNDDPSFSCPKDHIQAEVEECTNILKEEAYLEMGGKKKSKKKKKKKGKAISETKTETGEEDGENEEEDDGFRRFYCEGKCGHNPAVPIKPQKHRTQGEIEDDHWDNPLKMLASLNSQKISLYENTGIESCNEIDRTGIFDIDCSKYNKEGKCFRKAITEFLRRFLNPICRKKGTVDLANVKESNLPLGKGKIEYCIGDRKTVQCRKMEMSDAIDEDLDLVQDE